MLCGKYLYQGWVGNWGGGCRDGTPKGSQNLVLGARPQVNFFPDGAKQNKPDKPFMKTTVVHLIPGSPFCFQRECHLLS